MNISSFLGLGIAFLVLWFGVIHPSPNPKLFLDAHALILVCGGTLAAALIGFPLRRLIGLIDFILLGLLFKKKKTARAIAEEMLYAYRAYKAKNLQLLLDNKMHPFIIESFGILNKKFSTDELQQILEERIEVLRLRYISEAKMLNAIAKFPPAFGLLGASTGMIVMMTKLGSGGAESIGPAMAIALVATFWGIAIANLILLPLSDYATKTAAEEVQQRHMIAGAVIAIDQDSSYSYLVEKLIGQVNISERNDFRTYAKELLTMHFSDYVPNGKVPNPHSNDDITRTTA